MSPSRKFRSSKAKSEKVIKNSTSPRQNIKKSMGKNMSRVSFMQRVKDFLNVANDKIYGVVENMKARLKNRTENQSRNVNSRVSIARPAISTSLEKSQSALRS